MKTIKLILLLGAFSFSFAKTTINYENPPKNQQKIPKKGVQAFVTPKNKMCVPLPNSVSLLPELWSNPATWGGTLPTAGQNVTIAANKHIILDVSPPNLAGLTINGKLEFERTNLNLTAHYIIVMGELEIGTETNPFLQKAIITLNATNPNENIMEMGTRGIMVMGGKLELHGNPPNKTWSKINVNAPAGSTTLNMLETINWSVNDEIVVAPTDYVGTGDTQKMNINTINGVNITTSAGLNAYRWGVLQYATSTGMSLTPGSVPSTVISGTPTILDERAEVGNLTRNIVIQAPNDALWQNNGFGCHVMIMNSSNTQQGAAHINGVEIKRGGQNGKLGRYPFHWHMISYNGTTTLPDATGQYIKNSTINESAHRGIVIHGTNGTLVQNNVVYKIKGHGIFTEDASERRNTIDGNLVLNVRNPLTPLKHHESNNSNFGSSCMWISNPDNIVINNTTADSTGTGFWLAYPEQTFGMSAGITFRPNRLLFGVFDNNTAHSHVRGGIHLDDPEVNNLGETFPKDYVATTDGLEPQWPWPNIVRHTLSRYTTYKNSSGGIWNRSRIPDNDQVVNADNCAKFFSGAFSDGLIKRSLAIGTSLNYNLNGVTRPNVWGADFPVGFASYHSTADIQNNFILNFPAQEGTTSGAFALDDYYLIPVDKGLVRNTNNTIINSHPGVRALPYLPSFTYGVLWDAHNYWGGAANQENYYVFNTPFFTYGQTPTVVAPSPQVSGGVLVQGPFYGVKQFVVNKANSPYSPYMKINVDRLNNQMNTVGTFTVEEPGSNGVLGNMRHFATHPTSLYDLTFPTLSNVNDFSITVTNMLTVNDYQVLAVEYNGQYLIDHLFSSTSGNYMDFGDSAAIPGANTSNTHLYQSVANLQAVINAPNGEVYWQDRVNNKVWFKVKGGLNPGDINLPSISDINLYKDFNVRAYGTFSPLSTNSFEANISNLEVYPNPTKDILNLQWINNTEANNKLEVYTMLGQKVFETENRLAGKNELQINTSNWNSGVYFVKLDNIMVKVVKQ